MISRTWTSLGPETRYCGFWLGLSPSHMGSSPKLGIGWVQAPVHGLESQSVLNGFSWWPRRDGDKVRKGLKSGLGPKEVPGTLWARYTGESTVQLPVYFWLKINWFSPMCLWESNSRSRTELYCFLWLWGFFSYIFFLFVFVHFCSVSSVNLKRLLLFPSLWPLQVLTLYSQLIAKPPPAHHQHHWGCLCAISLWQLLGTNNWLGDPLGRDNI